MWSIRWGRLGSSRRRLIRRGGEGWGPAWCGCRTPKGRWWCSPQIRARGRWFGGGKAVEEKSNAMQIAGHLEDMVEVGGEDHRNPADGSRTGKRWLCVQSLRYQDLIVADLRPDGVRAEGSGALELVALTMSIGLSTFSVAGDGAARAIRIVEVYCRHYGACLRVSAGIRCARL